MIVGSEAKVAGGTIAEIELTAELEVEVVAESEDEVGQGFSSVTGDIVTDDDVVFDVLLGCLGALDDTYIPVRVSHQDIPRYRNHKGNVSVNVLVVCDQHMNYIFVLSGWEGSTVDSRILRDDVTHPYRLRVSNELVDDGINGVEATDGFIDQVGASQACTIMIRSGYLLILENMLVAKFLGSDLK
ncbi:hypothetical protein ACS0TY_008784 [Phlomoides rotata]